MGTFFRFYAGGLFRRGHLGNLILIRIQIDKDEIEVVAVVFEFATTTPQKPKRTPEGVLYCIIWIYGFYQVRRIFSTSL